MVFDRRPEELFTEVVSRGLETLKTTIDGFTEVIRAGDETIRELDGALTGNQPRFGETPQETFMNVLDMLHGTLEDAREKQSATVPSVVQKARQILTRINQAEPEWRPGPLGRETPSQIFRAALRDLRASNSIIKLAQGAGTLDDLKSLSDWADDVKARIDSLQHQQVPQQRPETTKIPGPKVSAKKPKKDTTPKTAPEPDGVRFALAVAEEYGDSKVKGWAKEYADGKISEQQWISRLTTHAAAEKDNIDDILERANKRLAREENAEVESLSEEK
jgi:hypothetical protein